MQIISTKKLTAIICYSIITTHGLPLLPKCLQWSKHNQEMFYQYGNYMVRCIDKYGIIAFIKAIRKEGYELELKKTGNFYRYWKKHVMGFDVEKIK